MKAPSTTPIVAATTQPVHDHREKAKRRRGPCYLLDESSRELLRQLKGTTRTVADLAAA